MDHLQYKKMQSKITVQAGRWAQMKRVAGRIIGMFVMAMLILGIINLVG